MANKDALNGVIDPQLAYSIDAAAQAMRCTPRYLRDTYLNTGDIPYAPIGRGGMIMGDVLIQWIKENMGCQPEAKSKSAS